MFNYKTGEWKHHSRITSFPERQWISKFKFDDISIKSSITNKISYNSILNDAQDVLKNSYPVNMVKNINSQVDIFNEDVNKLRWFTLPSEVVDILVDKKKDSTSIESFLNPLKCNTNSIKPFDYEDLSRINEYEEHFTTNTDNDNYNDSNDNNNSQNMLEESTTPLSCPYRPKRKKDKYPLRQFDNINVNEVDNIHIQKTLTTSELSTNRISKAVLFPKQLNYL